MLVTPRKESVPVCTYLLFYIYFLPLINRYTRIHFKKNNGEQIITQCAVSVCTNLSIYSLGVFRECLNVHNFIIKLKTWTLSHCLDFAYVTMIDTEVHAWNPPLPNYNIPQQRLYLLECNLYKYIYQLLFFERLDYKISNPYSPRADTWSMAWASYHK